MTLAAASHKPETRAKDIEAASSDRVVAELIEQLTERFAKGDDVDLDAFLLHHPQHADRLRALVPALRTLAEINATSGSAVGNVLRGVPRSEFELPLSADDPTLL